MKDVEAQLIHDMHNTAVVLREAATQLNDNRATLPPGVVAHLCEMLARRSDMLVRLLGDLSTSTSPDVVSSTCHSNGSPCPPSAASCWTSASPAVGRQITVGVADDTHVIADPTR